MSRHPLRREMPKPKKGPAPPQYVSTPARIAEMDEGKMELEYMKGVLPTSTRRSICSPRTARRADQRAGRAARRRCRR